MRSRFQALTVVALALLLAAPSFAARGSFGGGGRSFGGGGGLGGNLGGSRISRPPASPPMPSVSTPVAPRPSLAQPTPPPATPPGGSFVQTAPKVSSVPSPGGSLKSSPVVAQPLPSQPAPGGSFKRSTTPGVVTSTAPNSSFRKSVPGTSGPSFRRTLPTTSRVPNMYAGRVPTTTRTYVYNGTPMVANYYGGLSGYSYAWGHPMWYYSTPFHPAFYMSPPVVVNGQMYPGSFSFARFFFGLLIWCVVIYCVWRFLLRRLVS